MTEAQQLLPKGLGGEGERWTSLLLTEDRPESTVCIVFLILKMSPPNQATQALGSASCLRKTDHDRSMLLTVEGALTLGRSVVPGWHLGHTQMGIKEHWGSPGPEVRWWAL